MKRKTMTSEQIFNELFLRYPQLEVYPQNINMVYEGCNNCMGTHPEWAFECYKGLSEPECMYKVTPEIVMKNIKSYMDSIRKEEK